MRVSGKIKIMTGLCGLCLVCVLFISGKPKSETVKAVTAYYGNCLDSLQHSIVQFQAEAEIASAEQLKKLFVQARHRYKKIEWLIEYYYPSTAQSLNGPALPEAEPSEPAEAQHASGFQVLEESVYDDNAIELRKAILFELSTINNRVQWLHSARSELELTESNILDALKLNLYRIITKGITGFDSPVAANSIHELLPTLTGMKAVLSAFHEPQLLLTSVDKAIAFVTSDSKDFNAFNRALFITNYINPLGTVLVSYQRAQGISFVNDERAVSVTANTLFDNTAFHPLFYAPSGIQPATPQQILLGRLLFAEPLLSSTGKRSCASCHRPEKAFTDGIALNRTLTDSGSLLRNTPTLINAALQPVQFYDSRIAFLEDQVHDVISSRQEMGGLFDAIVKALQKKRGYKRSFSAAFGDKGLSAQHIRTALAAYVRSLIVLNSPFDRYMRGDKRAMNSEQVAGFNLFAGKAKCATCHFMPTFSGSVPPLYDKMESEVLGVPATPDTLEPRMDADSGRYHLYKIPHQLFSFKTSSLRNVALTAPYMHNGVFATLEEVIDFYDRGGGAGLGFDLPNQTLPPDKLNLTPQEKKQLIAFLHALTDESVEKVLPAR